MNIRSLSPFISSTLLVKGPLSTPLSPVVRATILFAIAFFAFCIGYGLPHLFQQGFHAKLKNILYSRGDINQLIQFLKNNPLKLNEVQDLRLNHFKTVRDNDLKILASLCPCLRSLEISNCDEITDDGIENLQVLRSLRSLSLRAGCTKITDKGIEHLKHHTGLNFFELGNCHQITDAGLKPLENLSFLSHLYLSDTPLVTDNGLESIGKLINLKSLTLNFLVTSQKLMAQ